MHDNNDMNFGSWKLRLSGNKDSKKSGGNYLFVFST